MKKFVKQMRAGIERTRDGFWFAHERVGSGARVHYGNVYELPEELGRFDVAVLCSVLLHLRDPLRVLENCARLADTLVVTDIHYPDFPNDRPMMQFFPLPDAPSPDLWWRFTPQLFVRFAEVMGYTSNEVSFHEQLYVYDEAPRPATMFTVVSADRESAHSRS
jgi:SAM-dependent methyltransferase